MPTRPLAAFALVVLTLAACQREPGPTPALSEPTAVQPAPSPLAPGPAADAGEEDERRSVELVVAGAEPRGALRYRTPDGWLELAELVLENEIQATLNGKEMPSLRIPRILATFHTKSDAPQPEGGFETVIAIANIRAEKADEQAPEISQKQLQTLMALERTAAELHFDRLGAVRRAALDTPEHIPPALRNIVDAMEGALRLFVVPFPEEPVGVGAMWKVRRHFVRSGVRVQQTSTYELAEIEGEVGRVLVQVTESGQPGTFHPPHLPAGSSASLDRMIGKGGGEVGFHLARLSPVALRMKVHTEMDTRVGPPDKQMTMTVITEASTRIERKEPPKRTPEGSPAAPVQAQE